METQNDAKNPALLSMTASIVAAYVGKNSVATTDLPTVINTVYSSLTNIGQPAETADAEPLKPAVPIRKSVTPDYIVCLEDGKKLKMLKRHLRSAYGMSPEEYRARWGLPPDYPMTAPNYAASRSDLAKQIGLGRNRSPAPVAEPVPAANEGRGRRRTKAA